MGKKLTTEQCIDKAKNVHGNNYDYCKSIYKGYNKKIEIICKKDNHGNFWQTPANHITVGQGCPICAKEKILQKVKSSAFSTKTFIEKSKTIHKNWYKYEKTNYVNIQTKVKIICPIHGLFEQKPVYHLLGKGCPKCANSFQPTTEKYIEKAKLIYGDKYSYEKIIYKNAISNVEIICKVNGHGSFFKFPNNHLKGQGCPKCEYNNRFLMTEEFVNKAKTIYGNEYNYKKSKYISMKIKVEIICNTCRKSFWQIPNSHLSGHGCPKCANSKMERNFADFLESFNIIFERQKSFNGLIGVNGGLLRFDFYLPKQNLLIECDGEQHFKHIKGMMKINQFETIQKHDNLKNEWCKNNQIKLLRLIKNDFKNNNLVERILNG